MKNRRIRKNKYKMLNSLLILITAGVIAVAPVIATSTPAHALPDLPSAPDAPDSPDDPDAPDLPGNDTGTNETTSDATNNQTEENTQEPTNTQTASNSDTGADSTNEASTSTNNDTDATLNNDANIDNDTSASVDTGNNDADKNTGDGSVNSGDAGINANLETDLNQVVIGDGGEGSVSLSDLEAANENTGAGSSNDASSENTNDTDLAIDNDLNINNSGYFDADSGHNSASYNTGDGEVVAGDADIVLTALNVGNNVNVGTQVFNVYDDQTGDLVIDYEGYGSLPLGYPCSGSAGNDTTGADSENNASTSCDASTTILVDNFGNVVNDYYLSADTGDNTADKNTGDGSVSTGDANIALNIINFLNNTFLGGSGELLLGVVNIFGNLSGDILLNMPDSGDDLYYTGSGSAGNASTGADSENNANTNLNNETDISMINSANILNDIMLFADTGDNTADKNTDSGQISTGDVDSNLNVANISNMNVIGSDGTLWMVLVNNLGEWSGQIWGLDSTGTASPFFTFAIGEDGAFNAVTGADSTNNASTETNNDTDIAVNNTGNLTNNIYINANTGGNSASMNTGSGNISTGDVNVAANVVNMLNNNFIAGKFVLTIVNVFGSFLGDIFPGGEESNESSLLADDSFSISVSVSGVENTAPENNLGTSNTFSDQELQNSASSNSETSKGSIASVLTSSNGNAKVDSITKVIGKDSKSITDYWWVVIPLLLAAGSVAVRRRFLWKVR
jgi:hypothetical protein